MALPTLHSFLLRLLQLCCSSLCHSGCCNCCCCWCCCCIETTTPAASAPATLLHRFFHRHCLFCSLYCFVKHFSLPLPRLPLHCFSRSVPFYLLLCCVLPYIRCLHVWSAAKHCHQEREGKLCQHHAIATHALVLHI